VLFIHSCLPVSILVELYSLMRLCYVSSQLQKCYIDRLKREISEKNISSANLCTAKLIRSDLGSNPFFRNKPSATKSLGRSTTSYSKSLLVCKLFNVCSHRDSTNEKIKSTV